MTTSILLDLTRIIDFDLKNFNVTFTYCIFWHFLLHHPTYFKIHTLKSELNIDQSFDFRIHCYVCHFTK